MENFLFQKRHFQLLKFKTLKRGSEKYRGQKNRPTRLQNFTGMYLEHFQKINKTTTSKHSSFAFNKYFHVYKNKVQYKKH